MRRKLLLIAAIVVLGLVIGVTLSTPSQGEPAAGQPTLLAHRGIAQRFDERDLRNDTCTAARMLAPRHPLLENTLPSIEASFKAGADMVEIDVHPTTDGHFVVFHDWTLECRTDGRGTTRSHSLAELKRLDVGHGYTADGGRTFPFRGRGVGLMPSLDEVLQAFPSGRFVINVKSRDPAEGRLLAEFLGRLTAERRRQLVVYGGDEPVAQVRALVPEVRTASKALLKSCLAKYVLWGWTGAVPGDCRSTMVLVPSNVTWLFWGWPSRFLRRMEQVDSQVFLIGPYSGGFTRGIDTPEDLARVPPGYSGGIWTNDIEAVARWAKRR